MNRRNWIGIKLVLLSVGFLALTIIAALCVRNWNVDSSMRGPASLGPQAIFEHRGALSASELGMLGSTVLTRGRKVVFHDDLFRNEYAHRQGFVVSLNLFPDTTLSVKFQPPSVYQVNQDIFVGQVEGDDDSAVRFLILNHVLDGTITTHGREYRVIDAGNGLHDITEASTAKN